MRSPGPLAIAPGKMERQQISDMIDASPMNRGLSGSVWTADERNVAIVEGDDAILFDYERPGVYQFHWLTSSRGRRAVDRGRAALARMFDEHKALAVYGLVPVSRPDVRLMARLLGARYINDTFTDEGPCQIFVMTQEIREGAGIQ